MPRVLLLLEHPTLLGGERSLLAIVPGLQQAGFVLEAMAPVGPVAKALSAAGVAVHACPWNDPPGERPSQDALRARLAELLGQIKPDLVHANSLSLARLSGPVAHQLGVPSIGHVRDMMGLSPQAVADVNLQRRLIAVSHAARVYHEQQGVAADRLRVVYNGIDVREFSGDKTRRLHHALGLRENELLVGYVGQLVRRKGADVLLRAATEISGRGYRPHLVLVGERFSQKQEAIEFEHELRGKGMTLALLEHVHFLGTRDDVPSLLPELDVLVHPARQEPFGRVLLEAAAAARCVIATDVGGTREIFPPDAHAAILVPPDDDGALADAMVTVFDDASLRQQMGAAARARVAKEFTVERACQGLLAQYHDVLG